MTHYRISDFAQRVGLTAYTLRYYEQAGLIRPQRDNAGRYYTDADAKWLVFLLHLKGTGMTMAELEDYVRWRAQGDATIPERIALLQTVAARAKAEIEAAQANLAVLEHKLDWYQGKADATIAEDESFDQYLHRLED